MYCDGSSEVGNAEKLPDCPDGCGFRKRITAKSTLYFFNPRKPTFVVSRFKQIKCSTPLDRVFEDLPCHVLEISRNMMKLSVHQENNVIFPAILFVMEVSTI